MKIKYINNDKKLGIDYDWNYIRKEYKKLGCPSNVYNPTSIPFESCKYFNLLSERSTGKTTNILLFGMIMNKHYGTILQYVRQREGMIVNKTIKDLFSVIVQFNYIDKLTDGKYNNVVYKSRRWYYCSTDDDGNIIETAPTHFMFCLSLDKSQDYKSSYNAPAGDFIIFDEYISKYYLPNEFVTFCDLVKTIIRDRQSPVILMLANTIDKHSQYFEELDIYDAIQDMEIGEKQIIETDGSTRVYTELIGISKKGSLKKKENKLFFGFKNPLLSAITGEDWAINNYPHIDFEFEIKIKNIYLEYNSKLLKLDIFYSDTVGWGVWVHKATKTYDDSIIYSIKDIKDKRHRYRFGLGNIDKFIWNNLYRQNKFYYSTNSCGSILDNYIKQAKKL